MIITHTSTPTGMLTLAISRLAMNMKQSGQKLPEQHASDDAQPDPDSQVTFEQVHLANP